MIENVFVCNFFFFCAYFCLNKHTILCWVYSFLVVRFLITTNILLVVSVNLYYDGPIVTMGFSFLIFRNIVGLVWLVNHLQSESHPRKVWICYLEKIPHYFSFLGKPNIIVISLAPSAQHHFICRKFPFSCAEISAKYPGTTHWVILKLIVTSLPYEGVQSATIPSYIISPLL